MLNGLLRGTLGGEALHATAGGRRRRVRTAKHVPFDLRFFAGLGLPCAPRLDLDARHQPNAEGVEQLLHLVDCDAVVLVAPVAGDGGPAAF